MRTRNVLSLLAAASASVIVGTIVVEGTAASSPLKPAAGAPAGSTSASGASGASQVPSSQAGSFPSTTTPASGAVHRPATALAGYAPPRPGRYRYDAPSGTTFTTVEVHPTGPGVWEVDESIATRSAVIQARREIWSSAGVRVIGVWEASQPRPCVWSNAPVDVGFPLYVGLSWSIDTSCRVSHGTAGVETTHAQGSFRTAQRTTLTIGGSSAAAWLIVGDEVTTTDGTVNGHRYHTVDRTTTSVWFVPSIGLPGRTELTGTVAITSYKGTVRHPISQRTQLESLSPQ